MPLYFSGGSSGIGDISALPDGGTVRNDDDVPVNRSGTTVKVSLKYLLAVNTIEMAGGN